MVVRASAMAALAVVLSCSISLQSAAVAQAHDASARASFMRLPIVQHPMNGGVFSAMSSDINPTHSTATFGAFSMLSYEGPEEEDA